jgi:DNA-binding NarL/FixJ family response regulator
LRRHLKVETLVRILIVARPGHFRDSLAAVLKTLPRVELFLVDGLDRSHWETLSLAQLAIALVDLEPGDLFQATNLGSLKEKWPGIRCIALVDNFQQARAARSGNVELALSRSASAGELLSAIQRLSVGAPAPIRYVQAYPASVIP